MSLVNDLSLLLFRSIARPHIILPARKRSPASIPSLVSQCPLIFPSSSLVQTQQVPGSFPAFKPPRQHFSAWIMHPHLTSLNLAPANERRADDAEAPLSSAPNEAPLLGDTPNS
ncbi:hypothetical protein PtB15_12B222 [Puccinia triticina]|nr:hypothetical protein PtB15_12B222 [Puccinia triticina]